VIIYYITEWRENPSIFIKKKKPGVDIPAVSCRIFFGRNEKYRPSGYPVDSAIDLRLLDVERFFFFLLTFGLKCVKITIIEIDP